MSYKSSVLTCCDRDDRDCPVRKFLDGDRSEPVMMGVIARLDIKLELVEKTLQRLVTTARKDRKHG